MRKYVQFKEMKLKEARLEGFLHAPCAKCEWHKATCDVHHIKSKKKGGTSDWSNLIMLCPNCHRIVHRWKGYLKVVQ